MWKFKVLLLTSAIFTICESSAYIVEKVNKKCSINDNDCLKDVYSAVLADLADNGAPAMNIPTLDPFSIKNKQIEVLGMIKATMIEGYGKGFKTCQLTGFSNNLQTQRCDVEMVCEPFAVEGNYKIEATPTLSALIGGIKVYGQGKGGLVIGKVKLNLDLAYEVKKLDGELHFLVNPEDSTYTYEVLDKITFSGDSLFIGKQDISTVAVNIGNENWEFIAKALGKPILDKVLEVFYVTCNKFLSKVPIKEWITDDLSSYVKG
ncbi:protein takeout [Helicoverpa armigera]|uniref:Juvenile hormone binding protein an-0921 n=1 Tax=Helicoverpa armigera TaxID=29058 RepID=A0A168T0G3_HELAM|nr:juvenile hormone binding protein an-0921 [Helicoverpa armigera]